MKRIISVILVVTFAFCLMPTTLAATTEAVDAANSLHELGLFHGTGVDENGNPVYALDRVPTRYHAVIMLIRLLGKEKEAKSKLLSTPFTDVDDWAKPYVGYAYANGLTNGISATTFGGNQNVTATQYLIFALRALGYTSGVDFQLDNVWEFADSIELTNEQYNVDTVNFTRADVVLISYNALKCVVAGSNHTLIRELYDNDVVALYDKIVNAGLASETGLQTIDTPKNVQVVTENGQDYLTWDIPSQSVTSYDIYVSTERKGQYDLFFAPSQNYSLLETSVVYELKQEVTYYFKVRAVYWDEYEEQHYFSYWSEPISYTVQKNIPEDIHFELDNAGKAITHALMCVNGSVSDEAIGNARYYIEMASISFEKIERLADSFGFNDIKREATDQKALCVLILNGNLPNASFVQTIANYSSQFSLSYVKFLTLLQTQGIKMPYGIPSDWSV